MKYMFSYSTSWLFQHLKKQGVVKCSLICMNLHMLTGSRPGNKESQLITYITAVDCMCTLTQF